MTGKNPLDQIKHVATEALKHPTAVAGSGVRAAKHLAEAGMTAGAQLTTKVTQKFRSGASPESHGSSGDATTADADTPPAAADESPQAEPTVEIDPERPVNVVEELGLDPAPVPDTRPKPNTSIDAAADPDNVDATPADIANVVEGDQPKE